MTTKPAVPSRKAAKARKRKPADPVKAWKNRLARYRPNLADDTLGALASMYGVPVWERVHDPTSELILTILSANSADINAEKAFDAMSRHWPSADADGVDDKVYRPGWGGIGIGRATPDWSAVADAPIDELIDVIRPGGLAPTKAPRIQATLRRIREERGDYSLEFLGAMTPADALAWLTAIPGVGRKTASVVLLFSFGMPLIPVDRHVERVTKRIGLVPGKVTVLQAHDYMESLVAPELSHQAHVNLITHGRETCHAQRPACGRCAIAARCRWLDPKAP
jgi:endonuclease III